MAVSKSIRTINILLVLAFSLWVVSLWWAPKDVQQQEKAKPQQMQKQAVVSQTLPKPMMSVVLPAPPAPKVAPKPPAPKPVAQKVETQQAKPAPKHEPTKTAKPAPKPASQKKQVAKVKPPKPVEEKVIPATLKQAKDGRALLKVLEHGKGPLIEIAWPKSAKDRQRLYDVFSACYGMQTAVMDGQGDLYRLDETRGNRWEINLDRYSGFLREASGKLSTNERNILRSISNKHDIFNAASNVRIFPRRIDASLLGGLNALVGDAYGNAANIQAQYALQGNNVYVDDVHVDGDRVKGRIEIQQLSRCSRRV